MAKITEGPVWRAVALKTGAVNLAAGGLGTAIYAMISYSGAPGFAAGYGIGLINALWLMRIAKRSFLMEPDRAAKFVTRRYYLRFAATVALLAILISKEVFGPLALLLGLAASVFTTIGVMVHNVKEEVF